MPTYLVETYIPRSRPLEARAAGRRAGLAAYELSREGIAIRYVRTTFLPDDETCLILFEAASADIVAKASRRAELGRARVVSAVDLSPSARRRAT